MKGNREMFEEWYKSVESQYHKALNNYDAEFDCYTNDYIQCRYFAWQASASRGGYKLVPVNPTKEMYLAGTHELTQIDFRDLHDNDSIQVYKAMIGAAE